MVHRDNLAYFGAGRPILSQLLLLSLSDQLVVVITCTPEPLASLMYLTRSLSTQGIEIVVKPCLPAEDELSEKAS